MHEEFNTVLSEMGKKFSAILWITEHDQLSKHDRMYEAIKEGRIDVLEIIFHPNAVTKPDLWREHIWKAVSFNKLDVANWFIENGNYNPPYDFPVQYARFIQRVFIDEAESDENVAAQKFILEKKLFSDLEDYLFLLYLKKGNVAILEQQPTTWMGKAAYSKSDFISYLDAVSCSNMETVQWFFDRLKIKLDKGCCVGELKYLLEDYDVLNFLVNAMKTKDLEMVKFFNVAAAGVTDRYVPSRAVTGCDCISILDAAVQVSTPQIVKWLYMNRPNDKYGLTRKSFDWAFENDDTEMFIWLCENQLTASLSKWTSESASTEQKEIQMYLRGKKLVLF